MISFYRNMHDDQLIILALSLWIQVMRDDNEDEECIERLEGIVRRLKNEL